MRLDTFSNADRPRYVTFPELGATHTITIVEDPSWITDRLNADRELLKVIGQDTHGVYWQLNARSQMPDAIHDAIVAAGVDEILVGGELTVKWVDTRGQTKIYEATYQPPANGDKPADPWSDDKPPF
jgi:hypothetical protein